MTKIRKALLALGLVGAVAGGLAVTETATPVSAAGSYANRVININNVPGALGYFTLEKNAGLTMQCWTQGPRYDGQYKWFYIKAQQGRYLVYGYVPAPAVSNQTAVPLCPAW